MEICSTDSTILGIFETRKTKEKEVGVVRDMGGEESKEEEEDV